MKKVLFIFVVFVFALTLYSQEKKYKVIPAKIDLKPSEITVTDYFERFYTKEVTVLNRGGVPLEIKSVTGSCKCATATILNSTVEPMTSGKIMLNVNLKDFENKTNIVEYIIESNASNSPTSLRVKFDRSKNDSLQTK